MKILKFSMHCLLLVGLLASSSLASNPQEQTPSKKKSSESSQVKEQYTCPMHPEVKSDKEGSCPKCGMALVLSSSQRKVPQEQDNHTPAERIRTAKRILQTAKSELTRQGKYNCCIEDPCTQCALDHQSCPCYNDLKKGNPVCPECYGGWQRGEGRDKSRKASDVKTHFSGHKH